MPTTMLLYTQDRLFKHLSRSIVFLIFIAILLITSANGSCVSKKSQWGYTLEGSAYDSSPAETYPTCLLRCLTDKTRCKSLSYDLAAQTCELSIYSRWTKQWAFKAKTNSIYMEMIGVVEVYRNVTTPPSTPTPTTTKAGTQTTAAAGSQTTAAGGNFSPAAFCDGKPEGDYSHPTDCNQYVTCSPAISISRACGTGMNFHPVNKVCDFAANVVCP